MTEQLMSAATVFLMIFGMVAAVALALAAKPLSAWSPDAPLVTGTGHAWASSVAMQMIVGNVLVVGLHVWLMLPRYQRQPMRAPATLCCAA
jgi:hypothetical protein